MNILETDSNPLPLEPLPEARTEDRRLWIGNIDPRATEYQLVTLLQAHGSLERFDLLFHRAGPMAGRPRGYAFATFSAAPAADAARRRLDGANVGGRRLAVRWANAVADDESAGRWRPELTIAALGGGAGGGVPRDPAAQIRLLEAKLRSMRQPAEDFAPSDAPTLAGPSPYPYNTVSRGNQASAGFARGNPYGSRTGHRGARSSGSQRGSRR